MAIALVCPNCHIGMDESQLVKSVWTVEACPYCRAVIRKVDSFGWQDRDAIIREDEAAIDAWLESARERTAGRKKAFHTSRDMRVNQARWQLTAIETDHITLPWLCTINYVVDNPGIFEMRLTSNRGGEPIMDNPSSLTAICAEHGLQPYLAKEQSWEANGGGSQSIVWGVRLVLATAPLPGELFATVVQRLNGAMRDATMRLGLAPVG